MNYAFGKKLVAIFVTVLMCVSLLVLPTYAVEDTVEVIFEDVTASDETTLKGEAKVKVSVKGAAGSVSNVQMALGFSGDLKYKSIDYLQGENKLPECFHLPVNAALANIDKVLYPAIVALVPIEFTGDVTELFVLTFSGNEGEKVKIFLDDDSHMSSYCTVGGKDMKATAKSEIDAVGSDKDNEGIEAVFKLTMNTVSDFNTGSGGNYADSKITFTITNEDKGTTISTILNNVPEKDGGHRDGSVSAPTFIVRNTVLDGDTYTVRLEGPGYVTYEKKGYDFKNALEITDTDFLPGDVNSDGTVDAEDKALYEKFKGGQISEDDNIDYADFNRDGKVDGYDDVFKNIDNQEPQKSAPKKMKKPTVTGGSGSITVEWDEPDNGGSEITGYNIRYGTKKTNLDEEVKIESKSTKRKVINKLLDGTTYYVQIAAVNAVGTGEYSDIVNAKTQAAANDGGGGGGGGGGGSTGGGGGGGSTPSTPSTSDKPVTPNTPVQTNPNEPFTDLTYYDWAKDSIYTLKDAGIISGVSATEYAPANNIKRGDFILILTRMLGINDAFTENFTDVPENMYYYNAIGSAKAAGIAQGSGDTFMPENTITRQDLITLAYRAFLAKGYIEEATDTTVLDSFGDKEMISDYAVTAMASMVDAGIIKGDNGNVNPLGNATRAEVAVMCARLFALMN